MNKRQTKKKNKKIEERLEEFCETVEELKKLGVYSFSKTSFDEGLQLQIDLEDLLNLPFLKKEQITVSSREHYTWEYPFECKYKVNDLVFFSLLTPDELAQYFPEKIGLRGCEYELREVYR